MHAISLNIMQKNAALSKLPHPTYYIINNRRIKSSLVIIKCT